MYQVSNYGRVKSLDRVRKGNKESLSFIKGKIKIGRINNGGYVQINLSKDGINKNYLLHRLVAEAFIDNTNNLPQVNHKDENKQNNVVDNLEWCTHQYNNNYGTKVNRCRNKQVKKVYQYTLSNELVKVWESTVSCVEGGFIQSAVAACCRGEYKQHHNYKWSYTPLN